MEIVLFWSLISLGALDKLGLLEAPKPYIRQPGEQHERLHPTPADVMNKYE